ncbi:MAG: cobaltochelatase subunit CobN [Vicinamibacterales bacterium]
MRRLLFASCALVAALVVPSFAAGPKVALLSTEFVLERKFQEMQRAAATVGVTLAYLHVDHATSDAIRRALDGAALVIIDTPRAEDQAIVEKMAGGAVRDRQLPTMNVMTMSPPRTRYGVGISSEATEMLFKSYTNGTSANYTRMFRYITRGILRIERGDVLPPIELPEQGIWHPKSEEVFPTLDAYLAWLGRSGRTMTAAVHPPSIGVEISSSFIADGQTRMMEELVARIEKGGGVPVMFYRGSRGGRPAFAGAPPSLAAALASTTSNLWPAGASSVRRRGEHPGHAADGVDRIAHPCRRTSVRRRDPQHDVHRLRSGGA